MTNLEFIRTCDKTELADFLCHLSSENAGYRCDVCIAADHCSEYHNGFLGWLDEEYTDRKWGDEIDT